LDPRYPQQRGGEGIGYLILNVPGGTPHPFCGDNLLIFPYVGDGINGNRISGKEIGFPVEGHENHPQNHEGDQENKGNQPVLEEVPDESVEHGVNLKMWRFENLKMEMKQGRNIEVRSFLTCTFSNDLKD